MIISQQQMDELNSVQYGIFKAFHSVCAELNLKYYLVHGSLLGALRYKGFFPMDDDIDVAMPREDYEVFIRQGQDLIDSKYFIQSYLSERDYPLAFCKVRAQNTAFIQPVLKKCDINQGIYIDVFPIDNYPKKRINRISLRIRGWIYGLRTSQNLSFSKNKSVLMRFLGILSIVVQPSWRSARDKYCELYNGVSETGYIIVRGGKPNEVGISSVLFGDPVSIPFGDLDSYSPEKMEDYLRLIYGDFMNYEPMGRDMVNNCEVKISAEIIDVNKSYKEYLNK